MPTETAPEQALVKSPMGLLEIALSHNAAIDVIERLAALQEKAMIRESEIQFDEALNRCQAKLERVSADATNTEAHNAKYATYGKLDKIVRPIYTAEGFSLSFGEKDCPTPGKTRFVAYLSRSGVTREYLKDLTPSTKGPKGGDVMTPIHADASADSYAKRYMLKNIFNIAIGEDDNDGNGTDERIVAANLQTVENSKTLDELKANFRTVYEEAEKSKDKGAMGAYIKAKNATYRRLVGPVGSEAPKPATDASQANVAAPKPISQKQWAALHASAAERGITHEEIASWYRKKFHVEHGNQLTPIQFNLISKEVATWKGNKTA